MDGIELFKAFASLTLDRSQYNKDVKEADGQGKTLAENLGKYMDKAKKVLGALGISLGVKKIAGDIWNLAKATSAAGDRIDKQSQALGLSRRAYQEWDYILAQNGASIDNMAMSMRTLNEQIMNGSDETEEALNGIGLTSEQLQSLAPEDQLKRIVAAMQTMPAGANKSALAVKLFGRNAQSLMPLLNQASGSVEDLSQRARELGLIMSDEDIDASVAFGDALDDLGKTWTAIKQKFGSQMLPRFTEGIIAAANSLGRISTAISQAFETGQWSGVFSVITEEIRSLMPGLIDTVIDIAVGLFKNADKLVGLAVSIVSGLATGIADSISILTAQLPTIVNTIWNGSNGSQGLKDLVQEAANWVITTINDVFGTDIPTIDLSGVQDAFQWFVDNKEILVTAITAIIGAFAASKIAIFLTSISPLTLIFMGIGTAIGFVATNWESIKDWIGKAWNTTVTFFKDGWEAVKEAFDIFGAWAGQTWNTIVAWGQTAWQTVNDALTTAGQWIGQAWDTTVSWVNDKWTAVSDAFATAGEWVGNKVHEIAVAWKSTVDDWLTRIKGWFENKTIGEIAADFKATVSEWFETIKNWLGSTSIGSAILNFGNTVSEWFETVKNWIGSTSIGSAILNFGETVSGWFDTIKGWIESTQIGSATLKFLANVGEWFTRIWDWISSKTPQEIATDISATVSGWLDTIKSWLDGTGITEFTLNIGAKVGEWIQRIWDWVQNGIDVLVRIFSGEDNKQNTYTVGDQTYTDPYGVLPDGIQIPEGGLPIPGHAKGLNYVPYDNFLARLHRGEMVLNQNQARQYRQQETQTSNSAAIYIDKYNQYSSDDAEDLLQQMQAMQRRTAAGFGF